MPRMLPASRRSAQRLPSYLPAIYRDDPFLGRYLVGVRAGAARPRAAASASIATLFDPAADAPRTFCRGCRPGSPSRCAPISTPTQQREFLARIVPLYRRRGTSRTCRTCCRSSRAACRRSRKSDDTGPAHHFKITMRLPRAAPEVQLRQSAIAHALIDLEKPAHTVYDLDLLFPTMQIGVTSTIGVDTLLGTGTRDSRQPASSIPAEQR